MTGYSIHSPDGSVVDNAATIDHAQALARKYSKPGGRILVRNDEKTARGFGEGGRWYWARPCRACKGVGRTTSAPLQGPGIFAVRVALTCHDCKATGVEPAQ